MLENIDRVNWAELKHAYGTCENFPNVVRRLAHPDRAVRLGALSYISENLFHQGTHYDVNEFALPFLLEVAAAPQAPDWVPLFRLLQAMLGSEAIPKSPRQRKEYNAYLRRAYPWMFDQRGRKKKDSDSGHWEALFAKSSAAAWKCRKLLVAVIRSDQAAGVRSEAVRLLAEMARSSLGKPWVRSNEAAKLVAVFRRQAGADPDLPVRASCALALGLLRDESTAASAVAAVFAKAKAIPVRTACAAAWSLMPSAVPAEASRLLLEGILHEVLRPADSEETPSPLAYRYAELGLPLGGRSEAPLPPAALAVPFPELTLWLDASVREPAGLAKAAAELFAAAGPPRKLRLIALLGRLHLPVPALDEFLRSITSNRRESSAIRVRAAAALQERKAGLPPKRFEALVRSGLRSADPDVRRSVVDAVADIPAFLTPDGFENINEFGKTAQSVWDEFGYRLLPLVVGELGEERDPQVRLAFASYVRGIHFRWGNEKAGILEAAALLASWPDEPPIVTAAMTAMDFAAPFGAEGENAPILRRFYDRLLQYFHGAPQHRASAARLLLKIQSRQADTIPLLLPLLESDPDDSLRGRLAYALYCQSFQGPKAFPRESIDDVMLRVMRADRSPEVVRWACGWFNARLTGPRLLETVLKLFESDARSADGQSLRPYLVDVLSHARSNYPRVLNALLGAALDPSSGLRHAAMDALLIRTSGPEIPAQVCEEAMTRLLDSGDPEVLLWSLKRHSLYVGEKVRMKRMPELAGHPNPLVAQHAKEILERAW
jgi:HEAT repeat protein